MSYKHGIQVNEKDTSLPQSSGTRYGVQVIFGTCPVHLADDPYCITNAPIKISNYEDAVGKLGYSNDWNNYTLCQSIQASHEVFQVNPVIYINVLDPTKHFEANTEKTYPVINKKAVIDEKGILKDTVTVKGEGSTTYIPGTDYILSYGEDEKLMIALLPSGSAYDANSLKVSSKSVDPSLVTEADIIGAYDSSTGTETGLELIRRIFPRFQIAPAVLLAPGWSHKPNVAAAIQGKCEEINGVFTCECLLDIDTELTKMYTDCAKVKTDSGFSSPHAIALWPQVTLNGKQYAYSAVYGALMSSLTSKNDDIPYVYPSNKLLNMDGAVLADGTEVMLDQVEAAQLNGDGIVTAINDGGWKAMGNNTTLYPDTVDPKDRWIACRRMFSFVRNYFAINLKSKLDENMNRKTIDDIVNVFNIWGNSLVSSGICAGLSAVYINEKGTMESIMEGQIYIGIKFAPYTPTEYIDGTLEFDLETLKNALNQSE